jgi:hypothetical protein
MWCCNVVVPVAGAAQVVPVAVPVAEMEVPAAVLRLC